MKFFTLIFSFFLFFQISMFSKTLTFVATQFPPYVYNEYSVIKGFNVEILNEIFRRMNIKVNYLIVPWARGVEMVRNGQADAIFPFFKTPQRELFTDYSNSFTSEPIAMFVLNNSDITYNGDLRELSQYKFGRVRGFSSGVYFDTAVYNNIIQVEVVSKATSNIKKLIRERFDILVDNRYFVLHELKKMHKLNVIKQLNPILANNKAYLGFSKKRNHKEIIEKFNVILEEIKKDGTHDKIIDSYFKK